MLNHTKFKHIIGVGILLTPMITFAEAAATTTTTETTTKETTTKDSHVVAKDVWLENIKKAVPVPICRTFVDDASIGARMKERNISYDQCLTLIPPMAERCAKKYYDELPAMIDQELASKWGRTLGECIGGDFAIQHLYSGSSNTTTPTTTTTTVETKEVPKAPE